MNVSNPLPRLGLRFPGGNFPLMLAAPMTVLAQSSETTHHSAAIQISCC